MKATKWPSEYGWRKDSGSGNREMWGDKGTVDMDGTNTRAQVVSARRRFLGGETGYCQKGGPTRSNGTAQSGLESRRCCGRLRASGRNPWGEGAASGRDRGLVSVGGPREVGGAVWEAGPGPVLTMPGRSAYLGSAMAAARRGWGTETSEEPGPVTEWGRGWVRVPG